jgi:hypothetical protein
MVMLQLVRWLLGPVRSASSRGQESAILGIPRSGLLKGRLVNHAQPRRHHRPTSWPAGYTSHMSAHAHQAGRAKRPERTPTAIRAELPDDLRAQFDAEYQAALDDARATYRLDRLDATIEGWWRTVWARRSPGHEQAMDTGERILRGEPVQTWPWPPHGWAESLAEPGSQPR